MITKKPTAVYLLHFEKPYKHAKHYLGAVHSGVDQRLDRHELGRGARLIQVIMEAGITYELSCVWYCPTRGEAFNLEKRLKKHGKSRICPICIMESKNGKK